MGVALWPRDCVSYPFCFLFVLVFAIVWTVHLLTIPIRYRTCYRKNWHQEIYNHITAKIPVGSWRKHQYILIVQQNVLYWRNNWLWRRESKAGSCPDRLCPDRYIILTWHSCVDSEIREPKRSPKDHIFWSMPLVCDSTRSPPQASCVSTQKEMFLTTAPAQVLSTYWNLCDWNNLSWTYFAWFKNAIQAPSSFNYWHWIFVISPQANYWNKASSFILPFIWLEKTWQQLFIATTNPLRRCPCSNADSFRFPRKLSMSSQP